MDKINFLPDFENVELREELWGIFQKTELHARRFGSSHWVSLSQVKESTGGSGWEPGGCLELGPLAPKGTICHEVFHSAFHECALHDGNGDERWGDAFCDAFRYFMEVELGFSQCSQWFKNINSMIGKSTHEILERSTDRSYDLAYAIPAAKLIAEAKTNFDEFEQLWHNLLNERKKLAAPILDQWFCFSPGGGDVV